MANHLSPSEIKTKYSGLGKVRVEVWSYVFDHYQDDDEVDPGFPGADLEAVPEKALKGQALSICTRCVRKTYSCVHADRSKSWAASAK